MSYKVRLNIFEGPLDLLLYLVKKDHLNIYDIPIAEVTQQYLAYLDLMRLLDLNIAGEFMVVAIRNVEGVFIPAADTLLKEKDILMAAAKVDSLKKIKEKFNI